VSNGRGLELGSSATALWRSWRPTAKGVYHLSVIKNSALFEAFLSEERPVAQIDGSVFGASYEVLELSLNWHKASSGSFKPPWHFVLQNLTPFQPIQCAFLGSGRAEAYRVAGNVMWLPPEALLHCRWTEGSQQTVGCLFNVEKLAPLVSTDWRWDWESVDIHAGLDIRNPYVAAAMRRLAEETMQPGLASEFEVECALSFMVVELRRHLTRADDSVTCERGKLSAQQLRIVRELIEGPNPAAPTLRQLASACKVSGRQLSTMFRNTTGVTIRTYVSRARLEKAQNLLLNGALLTKQVAYLSGFSDPASFTAAFRRSTGVTPSTFRLRNNVRMEINDVQAPISH
jgi:AraC family transcriptional regulator